MSPGDYATELDVRVVSAPESCGELLEMMTDAGRPVPMTDDEIDAAVKPFMGLAERTAHRHDIRTVARAVERHHKIGPTP